MSNGHEERAIRGEVEVHASLDDVWEAWTTEAGIKTFFAPACRVECRVDGPYEIFFDPDAPPGKRGAEGMRILAIQPRKMLAFTWNAPPHLSEVRRQRTHVTVRCRELDVDRTLVTLFHDGWGQGGQWDEAFDYFTRAWNQAVLSRLVHRFREGPVDWEAPPAVAP